MEPGNETHTRSPGNEIMIPDGVMGTVMYPVLAPSTTPRDSGPNY